MLALAPPACGMPRNSKKQASLSLGISDPSGEQETEGDRSIDMQEGHVSVSCIYDMEYPEVHGKKMLLA